MKKLNLIFSIITLSVIISCSGNKKDSSSTENEEMAVVNIPETPERKVFAELFDQYKDLSEALASDKDGTKAAQNFLDALPSISLNEIPETEKEDFEKIISDIQEQAEFIVEDVDYIDYQREHLVTMSEDLYELGKRYGVDRPLYKIFCSMYDDDTGAYWLSESKEVKNPYYGSGMLACGVVQEELD